MATENAHPGTDDNSRQAAPQPLGKTEQEAAAVGTPMSVTRLILQSRADPPDNVVSVADQLLSGKVVATTECDFVIFSILWPNPHRLAGASWRAEGHQTQTRDHRHMRSRSIRFSHDGDADRQRLSDRSGARWNRRRPAASDPSARPRRGTDCYQGISIMSTI